MGVEMQLVIFWIVVFAAMVVIELVTLGLTTIWFAGGALVGLFVSMTDVSFPVQMLLFLAVSFVLLILVRPWARKRFNHGRVRTNVQGLIGQTAVVTEDIDNVQAKGSASVQGQEWMARNVCDEPIAKGTQVTIREVRGVKLIVEPSGGQTAE